VDVGCDLGLDVSVSRPSRGAVVPRLGLALELVRFGLVSVSIALKALVSVSPRSRLKRPRAYPRREWRWRQAKLGLSG